MGAPPAAAAGAAGQRYQAPLPDKRYIRSVASRASGEARVRTGLACKGHLRMVEVGTSIVVFTTVHCDACVSRCNEWVRSQAPNSLLGRLFPVDPRAQAALVAHLSMAGMQQQPTTVIATVNAMLAEASSFDQGGMPATFEACAIQRACAACAQTGTDSTVVAKGSSLKFRQKWQREALERPAPPAYIGVQRMYVSQDDVYNLKARLQTEASVGDQSSVQAFVAEYVAQGLASQRALHEGDEQVLVRVFMHQQGLSARAVSATASCQ